MSTSSPVQGDVASEGDGSLVGSDIGGEYLNHNNNIVNFCRVMTSLVGGCTAGILGITSWHGILFYIFITTLVSLMLGIKSGFNFSEHFMHKNGPLFDGLLSGVMTYVLFWTLMYDVAYVYT
eukprot:TRINITY_DN14652_c0_g1_i1.p1 TRINITY_DN14652_c0_g1~~TRINITY_DN14652_c0_g1_i1.p1  ORF type:complete len:122 (+),score=23.93 TRINITY_DN14652_c0_g1_i1:65-430(+)